MKVFKYYYMSFFILSVFNLHAQMIANIETQIQTDFATYQPYTANFIPSVPFYHVENDFSNVSNYTEFADLFNHADTTLLLQNHFTVKKSPYKQLYDIYNSSTWLGVPIFVTTDAVLHIYHVLYDKMLTKIEMLRFVQDLDELTRELITETEMIFQQSEKESSSEAIKHNLAFLYVANKLLNYNILEVPEMVSTMVDSELSLISKHDGYHNSPILGDFSELDYSKFIPRGHYTRNDTLKAYFKTMMWYGWTIFTMEPQLFGDLSRRHTLQALLLTQKLYEVYNRFQLWESIYLPTVFFVGRSDDPEVTSYYDIATQVYGSDFLSLSPDSLANTFLLDTFMDQAQILPEPLIPNWIYGTFITYKGFRFMGQRFIPDSYMFAHLVLPDVDNRLFPKGLDIMAILDSDRAYTILDSVYKETTYPNYDSQIQKFQNEFKNKSDFEWAQNLYWNWLYCLMPLLYPKGGGYPYFMQTLAWADKELLAALASWAELRHDTILYAKQSETPWGGTTDSPNNYVEPNPHLYARLASLVKYTRDGLLARNLLLSGFQEKLELFETLLLFLRDMSIKELENIPLSISDHENIFCFGKVMENLISEIPDPQTPWNKDGDDMAVIADVHTDSNTNQCLEEAVGYPLEIYVIVNEGGTLRLTRGSIFSYYEFQQPIADRLTDEQWREMLQNHNQPELPKWVNSFMDLTQADPEWISVSPENLYNKEFSGYTTDDYNNKPTIYVLSQNYPNPFNLSTSIEFTLPQVSFVSLKVFNLLGEEVITLVSERLTMGKYKYEWSPPVDLASGIYLYRLRAGKYVETRKMILMK